MAEDRKDEAKAPHWTPGQLTEASSHPHSPEIKDQGGASAGLVRSANGFPFREDEELRLGGHEQPGTFAQTKENGINGELSSGNRETAGNAPRCPAAQHSTSLGISPGGNVSWSRAWHEGADMRRVYAFWKGTSWATSSPRVTEMIPAQDSGQCSEKASGKGLLPK